MWKQVQCPVCKSQKAESHKWKDIKFGILCIVAALVVLYITEHYIVFAGLMFLGLYMLTRGLKNRNDYTCKACNSKFKA
jgi:hypothetical protein